MFREAFTCTANLCPPCILIVNKVLVSERKKKNHFDGLMIKKKLTSPFDACHLSQLLSFRITFQSTTSIAGYWQQKPRKTSRWCVLTGWKPSLGSTALALITRHANTFQKPCLFFWYEKCAKFFPAASPSFNRHCMYEVGIFIRIRLRRYWLRRKYQVIYSAF